MKLPPWFIPGPLSPGSHSPGNPLGGFWVHSPFFSSVPGGQGPLEGAPSPAGVTYCSHRPAPTGPGWTDSHCPFDLLPFAPSFLAQEPQLCSADKPACSADKPALRPLHLPSPLPEGTPCLRCLIPSFKTVCPDSPLF